VGLLLPREVEQPAGLRERCPEFRREARPEDAASAPVGLLMIRKRSLLRVIVEQELEIRRLNRQVQDQARMIHTLRRVLRFLGFSEVLIEDEYPESMEAWIDGEANALEEGNHG
jgi:hypothetical protein